MIWYPAKNSHFWWSRFFFLRGLGMLYAVAFLCLINDGLPLLGSDGLLPVDLYLQRVAAATGSKWEALWLRPSFFHFGYTDGLFQMGAYVGFAASLILMLGWANVPLLLFLWGLYFSYVSVGQSWFSFGWESQLLETGFLAVFLVPLLDPRPFSSKHPPSKVVIFAGWWLLFRMMLGAGLIKLRGDPCS